MSSAYSNRLTDVDRRITRLPGSDDQIMKGVAIALLVEIEHLHRLILSMALAVPREEMDDIEGAMLDHILGND